MAAAIPGLAFYIKHVAQASRDYRSPDGARGPGKVIIVAFSLGGLITRYAATTGGEAGDISKVITIGVPNTGSFWANLGAPVRDLICTEAGVHGPAAICNDQWQVLGGLQAFGPKIAALKPLPPGISLNAIAGDETWVYQIWGSFWGGIPLFGDGVVATGSALAKRPGGTHDTFDTVRNPIVPGDTSVMHIPLKHDRPVQEPGGRLHQCLGPGSPVGGSGASGANCARPGRRYLLAGWQRKVVGPRLAAPDLPGTLGPDRG